VHKQLNFNDIVVLNPRETRQDTFWVRMYTFVLLAISPQ